MEGTLLFEKNLAEYRAEGSAKLAESEIDGKKYRTVEGVAAKAGIVNRNKRLYPTRVFEKTLGSHVSNKVKANKFLGELEHPNETRSSLSRAAVKFTEVWMEGDDVKYQAIILPTPNGKILEQLLEAGVAVGVSTRGAGSYRFETVGGEEVEVIQEDYRMTGIDFVLDESNPYGAVNKFESAEGGNNVEIKTLEQLKAHFPELVQQAEDAAFTEGATKKETDLKAIHENEVALAKTEAVTAYKESEEAKQYEIAFNSIVEAMKPHLPETVRIAESELGQEVTSLRTEVSNKTNELLDVQTKLQLSEAKVQRIEAQEQLTTMVESKVAGHKFESILRGRLMEMATAEEVEARFAKEVEFLESVTSLSGATELPAGSGIIHEGEQNPGDTPPTKPLTESFSKLSRLAGLNKN